MRTMTWSALDTGSAGFADGNGGHVFNFPGSAASAGDLLIIGISSDTTVSTPSGYTADKSDVANIGAYAFRKVAAGGETSVTITTSGNFPTALGYRRYSGATGTPFDVAAAAHNLSGASTTPAATTATLAGTGELSVALGCLGNLGGTTPVTPVWSSGYTNRVDVNTAGTGSTDQHLFLADNQNAGTAAESPNVSWTNASGNQTMIVVTYKPSAGGATLNGDAPQTVTETGTAVAAVTRPVDAPQTITETGTAVASVTRPASAAQTVTETGTATAAVTRPLDAPQTITQTGTAAAQLLAGVAAAQTETVQQSATVNVVRAVSAAQTITATGSASATAGLPAVPGNIRPTTSSPMIRASTAAPTMRATSAAASMKPTTAGGH